MIKKVSKKRTAIEWIITQREWNWVNIWNHTWYTIEITPSSKKRKEEIWILKKTIYQWSSLLQIYSYNSSKSSYKNHLIDEKGMIGKKITIWINPKNHSQFILDDKEIDARKIKLPI